MNSQLWVAFQEKMQIKFLFLHQKKFIEFLIGEIKIYRRPTGVGLFKIVNKDALVNPNRPVLRHEQFEEEYRFVIDANMQNLRQI